MLLFAYSCGGSAAAQRLFISIICFNLPRDHVRHFRRCRYGTGKINTVSRRVVPTVKVADHRASFAARRKRGETHDGRQIRRQLSIARPR